MLNPNSRGLPSSDLESLAVRFTSSANVTSTDTGQPGQLGLGGGQFLPAGVKQVPLTAIGHPLEPRRALATRFSGAVEQICGGVSPDTWQRQSWGYGSAACLCS